jgi:translation initiation factor 1
VDFARGAKGSGVTRIDRLIMSPSGKEELLKRFKTGLGCGGTIKDGVLEIQGDHREFIEGELIKDGYKVKRIG